MFHEHSNTVLPTRDEFRQYKRFQKKVKSAYLPKDHIEISINERLQSNPVRYSNPKEPKKKLKKRQYTLHNNFQNTGY